MTLSLVTLKMVTQGMVDLLVIIITLQEILVKDPLIIQEWEDKEVRDILQIILLVKDRLDKKDHMEEGLLGVQEVILATITPHRLVVVLALVGEDNMRTTVVDLLHQAMICTTEEVGVVDPLGLLGRVFLPDLDILHLHPLLQPHLTVQVHLQVVLLVVSLPHHNLLLDHQITPRRPATLVVVDILLVAHPLGLL